MIERIGYVFEIEFPANNELNDFQRRIIATIEGVAATAIREGRARVEKGLTSPGPGPYVSLVPKEPLACTLQVWLDSYPTYAISNAEGGNSSEMFGNEDEVIAELKVMVKNVIAGDVEFGYRQEHVRGRGKKTMTHSYGRIGSGDQGHEFTRAPSGRRGQVEQHFCSPY